MSSRTTNFASLFIVIVIGMYLLAIGRSILLPFVVAIVFWFFIMSLSNGLRSFNIIKRIVPEWLTTLLAIIIMYSVIHGISSLLGHSAASIFQDAPLYQEKLTSLLNIINQKINLNLSYDTLFKQIDIKSVLSQAAVALTNVVQYLIVILIYLLFLILETNTFPKKLQALSNSTAQYDKLNNFITNIKNDINHYIRIKSFISFLTGLLSYFVLIGFGVKNAEFWGILIFLLNYIPTIGSIVALALTILAVSIQFTTLLPFAAMSICLVTIQFLVGNLLETKITGNTLNLSPVVILLSLSFWGSIWGIVGMLLCVPLMTIINIVLGQFESTRNFAILMTASGELSKEQSE